MNLDMNPAELYFTALGLRSIYESQVKKLNSMKEEYDQRIKTLSETEEENDSLPPINDLFNAIVTLAYETKVVKSLLEKINVVNKHQTKEPVKG